MAENLAYRHQDADSLASLTAIKKDRVTEVQRKVNEVENATEFDCPKEVRSPFDLAETDTDYRRQRDIEGFLKTIVELPRVSEFEIDLAFQNAKLRATYLSENDFVSFEANDCNATLTKADLLKWRSQGRVFSVNVEEQSLFPAFQFENGEPKPIIAKVLSELPREMHSWQVAIWFDSSNGWLNWEFPHKCLDRADDLLKAAKQEALASCF